MKQHLFILFAVLLLAGCTKTNHTAEEWYQKGLIADNPDSAIVYYTRAIEEDTLHIKAYIARSSLFYTLGYYENAMRDYDRAKKLDPSIVIAYALRSDFTEDDGLYDRAIQDFDQAILLDSNNVLAHFGKSIALHSKGKKQEGDQSLPQPDSLLDPFTQRPWDK